MRLANVKIIALFVFLFIFQYGYSQLSLEQIFLQNKFVAKQIGTVHFLHTKPAFAQLKKTSTSSEIQIFNAENKLEQTIALSNYASEIPMLSNSLNDLIISNTDSYFLFSSSCSQLYRYSTMCKYFIATPNKQLISLSDSYQFYPTFSPNDKWIAFVKNNNLYCKSLETLLEFPITKDGEWNNIINGKSDWVYEEEFELKRAFEWNANSDKIAYLKWDESAVKMATITQYNQQTYPSEFTYKYPKVGEANAKVAWWYYDVKTKKNKQIPIPFTYEYIPRIYWNGDDMIALLLNRHQDTLRLISYNIKSKKTKQIYLETSDTYLDIPNDIRFLSDKSFMILSEKDGYNHIYHFSPDGALIKQITRGNFEVNKIYAIDENTHKIYYQSNDGNDIDAYICQINYKTLEKKNVAVFSGTNNAQFSTDASFFIHTFSSAIQTPKTQIIHTATGKKIDWLHNKNLQDTVQNIPQKQFLKIQLATTTLNAWMIKPSNMDSTKKYPLLMYVYGGPHSQKVVNEWQSNNDFFFNFLAENGIIVACVDNRGTNGKGREFKKATYLQLGKLETEDQTAAAEYFGKLSFIDSNRIGIFGWSYGGFMAANCLFESNEIFKAGIAVAPVTDWRFYDNIYTERYMRTPEENPSGYAANNPIATAKKLKGNFMLVHGTADDNVHFQHALELVKALNDANKSYLFFPYLDGTHGIGNNKVRYDLYLKMHHFLQEKL